MTCVYVSSSLSWALLLLPGCLSVCTYLLCHVSALVGIHIGNMLTEVINGGVNSFNRLLHPVAHVHDNGILHTVGLTRLFVCQFQVIVTLAQHISQLSDMCDMLSDALLHLSESVLHIAHLIVPMALFHWGIKLSFCHLAGCIYQLLQRFQLEMADKETEQRLMMIVNHSSAS